MATTKDSSPKPVVVAKNVTEEEVKALYNEGKNLYQIAEEVFGFKGEEAVERIRQIVGCA